MYKKNSIDLALRNGICNGQLLKLLLNNQKMSVESLNIP